MQSAVCTCHCLYCLWVLAAGRPVGYADWGAVQVGQAVRSVSRGYFLHVVSGSPVGDSSRCAVGFVMRTDSLSCPCDPAWLRLSVELPGVSAPVAMRSVLNRAAQPGTRRDDPDKGIRQCRSAAGIPCLNLPSAQQAAKEGHCFCFRGINPGTDEQIQTPHRPAAM